MEVTRANVAGLALGSIPYYAFGMVDVVMGFDTAVWIQFLYIYLGISLIIISLGISNTLLKHRYTTTVGFAGIFFTGSELLLRQIGLGTPVDSSVVAVFFGGVALIGFGYIISGERQLKALSERRREIEDRFS